VWTYQEDLRPEEIAEIERGDAEKTAQVEEDWAERQSVEREAQLEAAEADRQAWAGAQAEIRDRVARNTARRSQNVAQESGATL
jgi:hypothetical protein